MKKIVFIFMAIALASCGSSKVSKPQETRIANKQIKGEWTLASVTHNQTGKFDITLLNDTSKECFEGSQWKFVPNNNRGTYTITSSGCSVGERYFVFVVQEVNKASGYYDFLLKPTNEKYQSERNQGVRLQLVYLSDTQMTWEQTAQVDGKPFVITMNFVK
ncbi:MAG: lipocalin family protein [Capnocytophaga sp.]|nr:lipocalin family protein [Capnocytophaga sp.]